MLLNVGRGHGNSELDYPMVVRYVSVSYLFCLRGEPVGWEVVADRSARSNAVHIVTAISSSKQGLTNCTAKGLAYVPYIFVPNHVTSYVQEVSHVCCCDQH